MTKLSARRDWNGNADDFAKIAGKILAEQGFADDPVSPNVRLIRDYGQRGIVCKPERRGKEAIYGFRHLLEFVAARALVADGWPLAKIAEQFVHTSEADLLGLIPGEQPENHALSVARRLLRETPPHLPTGRSPRNASRPTNASAQKSEPSPAVPEFRERAARASGLQIELRDALRRLGLPADAPPAEQVTLIAIAPWCQLLVESGRLSRITLDEAEEIGRAITASLLNPTIRKGAK